MSLKALINTSRAVAKFNFPNCGALSSQRRHLIAHGIHESGRYWLIRTFEYKLCRRGILSSNIMPGQIVSVEVCLTDRACSCVQVRVSLSLFKQNVSSWNNPHSCAYRHPPKGYLTQKWDIYSVLDIIYLRVACVLKTLDVCCSLLADSACDSFFFF